VETNKQEGEPNKVKQENNYARTSTSESGVQIQEDRKDREKTSTGQNSAESKRANARQIGTSANRAQWRTRPGAPPVSAGQEMRHDASILNGKNTFKPIATRRKLESVTQQHQTSWQTCGS
jgi:hypothetical protein